MSEKLTRWMYGCDPVHIGWYQVRWSFGDASMRWWSGSQWLVCKDGPASLCGKQYGDSFRGLAAPFPGWKA